ncbi:MAG TPA: PLP-dependent aminotransferase family protein, partial [Methanosarcinales archaeon]|nr:PLP-dependent aminotransferase family protein [Methanosarcinales archaeon]
DDGIDTELLGKTFRGGDIKLFYAVPNFQNPSGITYSKQKRRDVADIIEKNDSILIEDDPYGELRFMGEDLPSMGTYIEDNIILLGTFSKIVAPGLRLGWICAKEDIMERIIIAKQASDLHSNQLSQRVIYQYLIDNDIDRHIMRIRDAYKKRRDLMVSMITEHFTEEVRCIEPEGGMFLWATLPERISSLELFNLAIQENVAFVPGNAFYVDGGGNNTLRLNFSNSDEEKIEKGIKRLANIIKTL